MLLFKDFNWFFSDINICWFQYDFLYVLLSCFRYKEAKSIIYKKNSIEFLFSALSLKKVYIILMKSRFAIWKWYAMLDV